MPTSVVPPTALQYIVAGQTQTLVAGPCNHGAGNPYPPCAQANKAVDVVGTGTEGLRCSILADFGATASASVSDPVSATWPVAFQGAATRAFAPKQIDTILMFG